jgi:arylsulfatase A-like enzyme
MKKLVLIFLSIVLFSCKKETISSPNILFIMADDHAVRALSAYDGRLNQTPNIDRIAKDGVIFRNSFVTNSICAPSRAVMLTGKFSHINGHISNSTVFDSTQMTFPKLLQEAGYQTALVGKWHLRSQPMGFDYWAPLVTGTRYYNPVFNENGEQRQIEGYTTKIVTDLALDWLDQRDQDKPFCLLLHHVAPHRTWQPDTSYLPVFLQKEYPVPENFFDDFEGREAAAVQKLSIRASDMDLPYDLKLEHPDIEGRFPRYSHTRFMNEQQKEAWKRYYDPVVDSFLKNRPEGQELDLYKYQRYMQDYLACIQSVDDQVGRVLDYLEANGLDQNTLVVYTSDQGFYTGEHGWFDKRFMYEPSLRTPLLMRLPEGYERKGEVREMVQNIDYAPTFLELAGSDIPETIQGKSLLPFLKKDNGVGEEWRDAIYYHYYEYPDEHAVRRHYGIRTDRYKLIHFYYDIDVWELYDLQEDPQEMSNLYGKTEFGGLVEELKERLEALQEEYGDTDRSTY